jgi:hypothetical protein
VPRYLVERSFTVSIEEMSPVGHDAKRIINERFPDISWEHSHVVVGKDGTVRSFCVYQAPDEVTLRAHAQLLGRHTVDVVHEIAGDASPGDYPEV